MISGLVGKAAKKTAVFSTLRGMYESQRDVYDENT